MTVGPDVTEHPVAASGWISHRLPKSNAAALARYSGVAGSGPVVPHHRSPQILATPFPQIASGTLLHQFYCDQALDWGIAAAPTLSRSQGMSEDVRSRPW